MDYMKTVSVQNYHHRHCQRRTARTLWVLHCVCKSIIRAIRALVKHRETQQREME